MKKTNWKRNELDGIEYDILIIKKTLFKLTTKPKYKKGDEAWVDVTQPNDNKRILLCVKIKRVDVEYDNIVRHYKYVYHIKSPYAYADSKGISEYDFKHKYYEEEFEENINPSSITILKVAKY